MYRIAAREFKAVLLSGRDVAIAGRELCGLLLRRNLRIRLVTCVNEAYSFGSSFMSGQQLDKVANKYSNWRYAGHFHTHVLSDAVPGGRDLENTESGTLRMIFDTVEGEARIWSRNREGELSELQFALSDLTGTLSCIKDYRLNRQGLCAIENYLRVYINDVLRSCQRVEDMRHLEKKVYLARATLRKILGVSLSTQQRNESNEDRLKQLNGLYEGARCYYDKYSPKITIGELTTESLNAMRSFKSSKYARYFIG